MLLAGKVQRGSLEETEQLELMESLDQWYDCLFASYCVEVYVQQSVDPILNRVQLVPRDRKEEEGLQDRL